MKVRKALSGLVASGLLLAINAPVCQAALTAEQRTADFTQLSDIVKRYYGPLRWKKESVGLDFPKLEAEYAEKVRGARSDSEFNRYLVQYLSSLKDAHVKGIIPSNYSASLGFETDLVAGKVLIDSIDTLRLPSLFFPFKRGDQLIALNGVKVDKLIDELANYNNTGNEASARRIGASRLTVRQEAAGMAVPKGTTTVTVLPRGAAKPVTVALTWVSKGKPLVELDDLGAILENDAQNATLTSSVSLAEQLRRSEMFRTEISQDTQDEWQAAGFKEIGSAQSMFPLPEGATKIPGVPVTAAIYPAGGKKVGILRINSYGDDNLKESVARALLVLEKESDVLVLDQTNNPGGSVSLVTDILGMFATESFQDMNFLLRPSMGWLRSFEDLNTRLGDALKSDPSNAVANALQPRTLFLENEVREALQERRFYTNPLSLDVQGSFGMVQPSKTVVYTKPVLLLVNEFDFSGGDMFPALMQDNRRATLFGARTSGAGGNVREYGPLANSYFKLKLTESLMVRPNGNFVENLGVEPEIKYEITEDDFMNGYKGYVQAFTNEALKLIGAEDAGEPKKELKSLPPMADATPRDE